MKPRFGIGIAVALGLLACRGSAAPRPEIGGDAVTVVRVPDGGIQPQAATGPDGVVHLVYFKGEPMHGDAYYVRSADGGASFSPPVRVNSQSGSVIATGTVRGAHLAVGRKGRVHVAWMGSGTAEPKAAGRHAPMLYARLNDAGDAFEPQRNLIQNYPGLDGGGSVAADDEGNVYVAWHAPRKEQTEADRHVWVVRSEDDGRTFGPEVMADPAPLGVCACCGMRIAAGTGRGEVHVLYRCASKTVHRDMQLLSSSDFGKTFRAALADPWNVGQCVMSTSSAARTRGLTLAAWETQKQIHVAALDGAGARRGPDAVPGRGDNRKHPALAVAPDGRYLVAWTEGTGWNKGGAVAWQVYGADGRPLPSGAGRAEGLPAWSLPAAFVAADGGFRVMF